MSHKSANFPFHRGSFLYGHKSLTISTILPSDSGNYKTIKRHSVFLRKAIFSYKFMNDYMYYYYWINGVTQHKRGIQKKV